MAEHVSVRRGLAVCTRVAIAVALTLALALAAAATARIARAEPATLAPVSPPAPQSPPEELDPFTFADFTWQSGSPRTHASPLGNAYVTGELRLDDVFHESLNRPVDDTISGSTEAWRSGENQITQLGIGGDVHVDGAIVRLMTQLGQLSTTTPRNDASTARGQWDLADMYRYVSEAYGGYHVGDPHRGVNVEAGLFMSYIGLWSYYTFDNWTYQPSYVSSNTPWFFSGVRAQWFPTDRLKIEPWLINGWQSYGRFNTYPGVGGQVRYAPNGRVILVFNQYALGTDTLGDPHRHRFHTDDSIQLELFERPRAFVSRLAMTVTGDLGCESGGEVRCGLAGRSRPAQYFAGFMSYVRAWHGEHYAATFGGGMITNPGRYLVLLPPINGATAATGSPYFTQNPGDPFSAYDLQWTFDYMPIEYVTLRAEFTYRRASVPYFTGHGGVTPPGDAPGVYTNQGAPGSAVAGWSPDLVRAEPRVTLALEVKL